VSDVKDGSVNRGGPLRELAGQKWARSLAWIAAAALAFLLPSAVGAFWTRVLIVAGLGAMMALGLNVIVGWAGLLNLGYIAYFAIGAYTYAILASPHRGYHLPFLLLFPLAGVLTGVVGTLLALPAVPLRGDYLALVTLGFGEIVRLVATNLAITNAAAGIINIDTPRIFSWSMSKPVHFYYALLILCVVEAFLFLRLERSRIGRAWTAIREDQDAARAMGVNTTGMKLLASAIGAVPAGLAGVLFAGLQTFVSPDSFKLVESISILSMVIVGGIGSVPGVILGALLLTVVPEPLRRYTEGYRMLIYSVLLLIFTLFRPQGIWPSTVRKPQARAVPGAPPGEAQGGESTSRDPSA
jgi:branched-chain amino acid transport system permease protein